MIVTETRLNLNILDSEICLPDYNVLRKDGPSKGGGALIFFRHEVICRQLCDMPTSESLVCKVIVHGVPFVVCAFYTPPNSPLDVIKHLAENISSYVTYDGNFMLAGDFNLPNINWSHVSLGHVDRLNGEALLNIAFSHNLIQVVEGFTRSQGGSQPLIDLEY